MTEDLAELLLPALAAGVIGVLTAALAAWAEVRLRRGSGYRPEEIPIWERAFWPYLVINSWWVLYGAALAMFFDLTLGEYL